MRADQTALEFTRRQGGSMLKRTVLFVVLTGSFAVRAHAQVIPLGDGVAGVEVDLTIPGARSLGLGGAFVALADDATAAYANPAGLIQLARPEISLEMRFWDYDSSLAASSLSGVGFGSYVYPAKRWTAAVYAHSMADVDFTLPGLINSGNSLTVLSLGASFAVSVNEHVSFGVGVSRATGQLGSIGLSGDPEDPWTGGLIPVEFDIDASSTSFVIGAIWQLSDGWSVGASYRPGPELTFDDAAIDSGQLTPVQSDYLAVFPDVTAIGASYRDPSGRIIAGFEWDYVQGHEHSQSQLRFGAEYVFLSAKPLIGIRAGLWHDPAPDHRSLGSSDELHVTGGIGIAFTKFQLDAAVDISDSMNTYSVSAIYGF